MIPCPGLWHSAGDGQEHMCVLLHGHEGDCLCVSCGRLRAETEGAS